MNGRGGRDEQLVDGPARGEGARMMRVISSSISSIGFEVNRDAEA